MRILVTGAAGLVGSGIAARLAQDHDVIGLDLVPGPLVRLVADCHDVASWSAAVGRFDAVMHTAALHAPHVGRVDDRQFRRTNVDATARLVDHALTVGACNFVLTSSTSVYGAALEPGDAAVWVDEQLKPRPRDIYDETKLAAEALVTAAGGSMTVTSLRMSRCFPEPAAQMAWYRLYRGIDRRDVAEAHRLALHRQGPPATYVISATTPFERNDAQQLLTAPAAAIERRVPGLLDRATERGWAPSAPIDRVYDNRLARREIGFAPRFGIAACLAGDWDPTPSP